MNELTLDEIRQKLVAAYSGNEEEEQYFIDRINDFNMLLRLLVICASHYNYYSDSQEQAAYYISLFSGELIKEVSALLVTYATSYFVESADISFKAKAYLIEAIKKSEDYDDIRQYIDLDNCNDY
ncbi:MAG: hypothetical protein JW927_14660 [Deltaproteobacteria bacterium]|nr:hypothetical protein [Deltaproteobacteria bacterium]